MSYKIIRKIIVLVCLVIFVASCSLTAFADETNAWRSPVRISRFDIYDNCGGFTNDEIDLIANVVTHEVGGINGYVSITYANGETATYNNGCVLHKIHARVLINQYNSSLFPDSLSSCISRYWLSGLEYSGYYSYSNSTWQHCREGVLDAVSNDLDVPSNVYAATCDPYFASTYPGYSLYATVYWNTGWYSGVFYYYQYNA